MGYTLTAISLGCCKNKKNEGKLLILCPALCRKLVSGRYWLKDHNSLTNAAPRRLRGREQGRQKAVCQIKEQVRINL